MGRSPKKTEYRFRRAGVLICLGINLLCPCVSAQQNSESISLQTAALEQHSKASNNFYIIGPGDRLEIELVNLPELSGNFSIGPDGTMYLPRLRALYVQGLTINELQDYLEKKFRAYAINPQVYIRPVTYRPIRVYIGGEVKRPGYYTLSGSNNILSDSEKLQGNTDQASPPLSGPNKSNQQNQLGLSKSSFTVFPTIFDAIQSAQGITAYSNLSKVQVTRKQPLSQGGGRIRTQLNFLSLITEGDESQNIRLLDNDVVNVGKSPIIMREQLLQAGRTNLTPEYMQVYVTGRVQEAGAVILPQGSSLLHAIDLAGGTKVLHGKIEFLRFTRAGEIDRRIFKIDRNAVSGDYRNPVVMSGDVIRVRETALTKTVSILDELTAPIVGVYSLYSIFDNFGN